MPAIYSKANGIIHSVAYALISLIYTNILKGGGVY